ncbi:MAG: electron transport complex subunit RsxC [Clostridia bacterium]|nr:electron transport complex subunit RsxC [Clostridia bacterium]
MAFRLKGAHVPHRKRTATLSAVRMSVPETVTLPMVMHIGAPATPVVKAGDAVYVGTLIAQQNGVVSSPVHASVSGTVSAVGEILLSTGKTAPAVTITSDGQMTADPAITPPTVTDRDSLIAALKKSGIVGLGGAGFPTYVKLGADKPLDIEELVINGAECEPYITSDSVTMVDRAEDIAFAIDTLTAHLNIGKVIIGIEKNKPQAIAAMKQLAKKNDKIQVCVLPSLYPQGGEKVLVYHTTGKVIPAGKLPIDVGCVVCNSTTMATIGQFLKTGMPLVEKCITVDGSAVKEPKNVIAPIGTSLKDVFEFCGGFTAEPEKVLYGGPMMGISVPDLDAPVLKNTNAVLALNAKDAKAPKTTACIKCGSCANHCPMGINPVTIAKALRHEDWETLEEAGTMLCMECGCCAFVCPAKRPIVQNNKLAKAALRAANAKEAK